LLLFPAKTPSEKTGKEEKRKCQKDNTPLGENSCAMAQKARSNARSLHRISHSHSEMLCSRATAQLAARTTPDHWNTYSGCLSPTCKHVKGKRNHSLHADAIQANHAQGRHGGSISRAPALSAPNITRTAFEEITGFAEQLEIAVNPVAGLPQGGLGSET
jgi:hypothetical protein